MRRRRSSTESSPAPRRWRRWSRSASGEWRRRGGARFGGRWCLGRAMEGTSPVCGWHVASWAQNLCSRGFFSPAGIVNDGSFGRAEWPLFAQCLCPEPPGASEQSCSSPRGVCLALGARLGPSQPPAAFWGRDLLLQPSSEPFARLTWSRSLPPLGQDAFCNQLPAAHQGRTLPQKAARGTSEWHGELGGGDSFSKSA